MLTLVSQAALFTILYSDSLARFVFDGDELFPTPAAFEAGEPQYKMVSALAILAVPSIFSGFLFKDFFLGLGSFALSESVFLLPTNAAFFESDFLFAY